MKRKPTLARLRRKLDQVFSRYIRQRDTGKPCVSCGKRAPLQCGHFVKRQHHSVRWDERNAAGQCVRCNHYLGGNEGAFCLALVRIYGQAVVEELLELKHTTVKHSRADLEALIQRYSLTP